MFQRISVIGLGYIGLPTAALFARSGYEVVGVDIDPHVIDTINAGQIHIVEPELDGVVRSVVANGRLRATLAAETAEAFMIAVPTPVHDGRTPDVSYIKAACQAIAPVLAPGNLVVLESTSPVGTTRQMEGWLAAARPDLSFPRDAGEDAETRLIRAAREVNDYKPRWVIEKAKTAIADFLIANPERRLKDVKVGCLGLSFKPDIDDLRESPALQIVINLAELGCEVLAVEPHIDILPDSFVRHRARLASFDEALADADIICALVKHSAFRTLRQRLGAKTILIDVVGL